MDAAVRHVRDGEQKSSSQPLCLILQQPNAVGGGAMLWQMVAALASSIKHGSMHAACVRAYTFWDNDLTARSWLEEDLRDLLEVSVLNPGSPTPTFLELLRSELEHPPKLALSSCSQKIGPAIVVIDSLSTALMYYERSDVLDALHHLQRSSNVAGVITLACTKVHDQQELTIICSLASCEVLLRPVNQLQAEMIAATTGRTVHVEAITSTLRHSGRVKIDSAMYEMRANGELELRKAPPNSTITAQRMARSDIQVLQQKGLDRSASAQQHETLESTRERDAATGFMKLTLSKKEKDAKEKVVLPFEHMGERGAYALDDFKQYLPPAAGGEGKGSSKDGLGHILYVRDSDNDYDSDEDPDDDLDI